MLGFFSTVKGYFTLAAILLVAAFSYSKYRDFQEMKVERDTAILQRDAIASERDKAIAAAKANDETISQLRQEKSDINLALNTLAAMQAANRGNTVTREVIIQNQASDPVNSAKAAPVLVAIIQEVQKDRELRRSK